MLKVEGLTKIFGGLRAVDNASLEVPEGRIVALIGPNGAGKTTLFALMTGFVKPDAGTVQFAGRGITGDAKAPVGRDPPIGRAQRHGQPRRAAIGGGQGGGCGHGQRQRPGKDPGAEARKTRRVREAVPAGHAQ